MADFRDCLLSAGLTTLPMVGQFYSWHNWTMGARSLWKRLDRVLGNPAWFAAMPDGQYLCLTIRKSDHSPLILQLQSDNSPAKACFRFDNFLADEPPSFI
ncbi:UNVERIFIED_CONTAM: hypothetical protein Scaly_2657200 [Sesamum calycinum]|uniref:Uncharacterized protein n=1 Tax=Sesamum calycinum TaxID=2727403 RepID=A0AAW2J7X4_9LAMI